MKFAAFVLPGTLLLGSFVSMQTADSAGISQMAIGFHGGSVWTSPTAGICVWALPLVGDFDPVSLFAKDSSGAPVIDKEHAYLIWVTDFTAQMMPANPPFAPPPDPKPADWPPYKLALVASGPATIYFHATPTTRDWSDLTKRSTWGEPVATFMRNASLVRSSDNLASDTFMFSATLMSARTFVLDGKAFNFRELIPHGMTCFEFGQQGSSWEAGTCAALGPGR